MKFRRYWWLLVIPCLMVWGVERLTYEPPLPVYVTSLRFFVAHEPLDPFFSSGKEQEVYLFAAEYLTGMVADWVNGSVFAGMVSDELGRQGVDLDASARASLIEGIHGAFVRELVIVTIQHEEARVVELAAEQAGKLVVEQHGNYLPPLQGMPADVRLLDRTGIGTIYPRGTGRDLILGVRLFMALLGGLGFIWLLEHFEPKVDSRKHVQTLGMNLLGSVPAQRWWWKVIRLVRRV